MKSISRAILIGALIICQSCATSKLWEDTNPNERVWIDADKITEAALKNRGVHYEIYSAKGGKGYLVEKSAWGKLKDYHFRALGTPVTLTIDAATSVVVVGFYVFLSDPVGSCRLIGELCH